MSAQRVSVRNLSGHTVTVDEEAGTMTIADDSGDLLEFDAKKRKLIVQISGGTIVINGGDISINNGTVSLTDGTITMSAPSGVAIESADIKLGTMAVANLSFLVKDDFIDAFNNHVHTYSQSSSNTSKPATQVEKQNYVTGKTRAE